MRSFRSLTESYVEMDPVPRSQYGSNPGGVHVDAAGDEHYVKHYHDAEQGRAEVLAAKIYGHMGIRTVSPEIRHVNGREAVVSRWNHDLEPIHHEDFTRMSSDQHRDLGRIYHGAILTKNWDVVGLTHDNLLRHVGDGSIHSIDQGGAFHFRAQGGTKEYGPDVEELHSLRDPSRHTGRLFGHVLDKDPAAHAAGLDSVASIDPHHVRNLFAASGLKDHESLHRNFMARREAILGR